MIALQSTVLWAQVQTELLTSIFNVETNPSIGLFPSQLLPSWIHHLCSVYFPRMQSCFTLNCVTPELESEVTVLTLFLLTGESLLWARGLAVAFSSCTHTPEISHSGWTAGTWLKFWSTFKWTVPFCLKFHRYTVIRYCKLFRFKFCLLPSFFLSGLPFLSQISVIYIYISYKHRGKKSCSSSITQTWHTIVTNMPEIQLLRRQR
jgi:hypothetical protein